MMEKKLQLEAVNVYPKQKSSRESREKGDGEERNLNEIIQIDSWKHNRRTQRRRRQQPSE